jgi:hypothetical protein
MNVAALRNVSGHREAISKILQALGATCLASSQPTLTELYRFAYIGYKAPNYWVLRGNGCPDGIEPAYAAVSKFCHGLTHLLLHVAGNSPKVIQVHWSPEELYSYAEKNSLLVGMREVCAGPPKLIVALLHEIFSGRELKDSMPRPLDEKLSALASLTCWMEIAGFLYEICRCQAWHWRSQYTGESSGIRDIDPLQPMSRNAMPYCDVAKNASKKVNPLSTPFAAGLLALRWCDKKFQAIEEKLIVQKKLADNLSNLLAQAETPPFTQWNEFHKASIDLLSSINRTIAILIDAPDLASNVGDREMEVFFGRSPFENTHI